MSSSVKLKLKPMKFFQVREFSPSYRWEELIKVYGTLDGNPAYLLEFNGDLTFEENLARYLRIDSILYQDALFVLREEFDDPRNYFAIIEAIARGKTTLGEIVNETDLDRGLVGKYIPVLRGGRTRQERGASKRELQEPEGQVLHQRLLLQLLV